MVLFVAGDDPLVAIGIGDDSGVHRGEIETGSGRRVGEMIALVPAGDAAVPQHLADRAGKFQRAAFELRGGAEARQAMDVGLVLGDLERRQVLHDRVRAWSAERNVRVLGDTGRIQRDVAQELRVGALEEAGHPHRKRIDRAQIDRHIVVGDHLHRSRQREIAVGTAKRKEQIDG